MTARSSSKDLELLRQAYALRKREIRKRLREFRSVTEDEYFYELAYCLLTPQTSAENAAGAVDELRRRRFRERGVNPEQILRRPEHYIRFHRTKAKRLSELRSRYSDVVRILRSGLPAREARDKLVGLVKGLGYKEATHFLRNVGRNDGLAILDRHILRSLVQLGAIRDLPVSLSRRRYLDIEQRFREVADRVGISLDELDLLFWSQATGSIRK